MRILLLFIQVLCLIHFSPLFGQVINGKIVDKSGNPIPNASLYIRELTQGIITNDQGEFQANLEVGTYNIEFSCLGYERISRSVTVGKTPVNLRIEMESKSYSLPEVIVSSKMEDPAYAVMRKAIAMAPFYLHQIDRYKSEIYQRGTMKFEKIPKFIKLKAGNVSLKDLKNKLLLVESQNEMRFTAPDNYDLRILAASTNPPVDVDINQVLDAIKANIPDPRVLDVVNTNIYDPQAMGRISPLSTKAFSYYKFTLDGVSFEGDHMINKIKVIPKKKNSKLVSGWLYIIENSWNIQRADLTASELGVTVHFIATFNEVKPFAFLPTAYDMDMKVDMMGVKASGKYYSSIQYKEVELNKKQGTVRVKSPARTTRADKPLTAKQQKAKQKIEKISAKENLSNRDAYKMASLMEKMVEPEQREPKKESLELFSGNSNLKLTVDSFARTRDSLYWNEARIIPLRKEEQQSYQGMDSLKLLDIRGEGIITAFIGGGTGSRSWLTGKKIALGKGAYFRFNGLLGVVPEYNFVDGFWLGQRLTFGVNKKNRNFSVSPSVYYTTAREAVNWQIDGNFQFAPSRRGHLFLSGGNTSTDFSKEGELRQLNSFSSLFFAKNPIRFYQKRYLDITNRIDITNGLILTTGISTEKRYELDNNLSYSFFGGHPALNKPGEVLNPLPDSRVTKYAVHLEYTPRYHYLKHGEKKRYAYSKYPTLGLGYVMGNTDISPNYHRLDFSASQKIDLNLLDYLQYSVSTGIYIDASPLSFPDFKHFRTNELFITGNALENSFSLPHNYRYSTNDKWLEAHLTYSTAYLLIKHLPFLQNYLFNESLHVSTLWIPKKNYTELGYSIGIRDVGGIGVFVGLKNGKYDGMGFTIAVPILRKIWE